MHIRINRHDRLSACLCICLQVSTRLRLDGFTWNLILRTFMKICRENPNFVKIGHKYWAIYTKTKVPYTVAGEVNSP